MLDGLLLLDFSSVGPGPRCTRLLADYGMRVVKIRPPATGTRLLEAPWFAYSADRGIDQVRVDLKRPEGVALVHRMIATADCLVESFRPGVADRLGIGHADVAAANPRLVYCSVSGYGQTGPYAGRPAHDLNWLALGGYLAACGRRADGGPALPGATVADTVGGYSTAVAVLCALLARGATGSGRFLDVSVIDAVLRTMQFGIDEHLAGAGSPAAGGLLQGGFACYDVYETADGRWLALGAIERHFWATACHGLGLEHLVDAHLDAGGQDAVRAEVAAAFRTRTADAWMAELGEVTCLTPVNSPAEVVTDPHLRDRPLLVDTELDGRPLRQLAPRLAVADPADLERLPVGATPPERVATVLTDFGLAADEIAALRRENVLS